MSTVYSTSVWSETLAIVDRAKTNHVFIFSILIDIGYAYAINNNRF